MSYRYRQPSTHATGPDKLMGNRRTVCEAFMAEGPGAAKVSENWDDVTCRACLNKRRAQ